MTQETSHTQTTQEKSPSSLKVLNTAMIVLIVGLFATAAYFWVQMGTTLFFETIKNGISSCF